MTLVVAKELGPRGITVNVAAPGPVDTPLFTKGKSEAQIEQIGQANPLGPLNETEDIARVVSFLAGTAGGRVSGQVLRANGGWV